MLLTLQIIPAFAITNTSSSLGALIQRIGTLIFFLLITAPVIAVLKKQLITLQLANAPTTHKKAVAIVAHALMPATQ